MPTPAETVVLRLAVALHRAGAPAHRLEGVLEQVAGHLGVEARVFGMPTAVFASLGPESDSRTVLLRVTPGGLDLGLQADLDRLVEEMLAGGLPADEALPAIEALDSRPERWSGG